MRGLTHVFLAVALASLPPLVASDPTPRPIRIPTAPVVPAPMPVPGAPLDLTGDWVYPVDSDVDFLLFAVPEGLVKVTKDNGPLRYRGTFVGGTGQSETKTFAGKYLAFVEAVGKGDVEIIIVPVGAKGEGECLRQKLRVNGGLAPQPPPNPNPQPRPAPVSKAAWVVVVEETSQRTPQIAAVLGDLNYWKTLPGRGLSWRLYDADSPDAKAKGFDRVGKAAGLPCVIFLDKDGKNPLTGGEPVGVPLPASAAGVDDLIKGVTK